MLIATCKNEFHIHFHQTKLTYFQIPFFSIFLPWKHEILVRVMYSKLRFYRSQVKTYGLGWSAWKHYFEWKKHLEEGKNSMDDRLPWLGFSVIGQLKEKVGKGYRIFEYGGGGSTLFFLDRAKEVVTVEHNAEW